MRVIYLGNRERKNELARELDRMVEIIKGLSGVEKVILFGSMAGGEIGTTSDLDLVVIRKTDRSTLSRSVEIFEQVKPKVAADILVYTPEEFDEMQEQSNRFVQHLLKNGRVVYEKKCER